MDSNEKIPFFLALSELVLDDANGDFLNFMAFSGDFLVAPSTRPFIDTLMFWYIKGVQVINIWTKFHLCLICSSRVFKFQMFLY